MLSNTMEICFPILWKDAFQYYGNILSSTMEICFPILWKYTFQYYGNMTDGYYVGFSLTMPGFGLTNQ